MSLANSKHTGHYVLEKGMFEMNVSWPVIGQFISIWVSHWLKIELEHPTSELYPNFQRWWSNLKDSSMSDFIQWSSMSFISKGWGSSHTLKTFSDFTKPKPSWVDCRLLRACLMSPWAVKTTASRPSLLYSMFSALQTSRTLAKT